MPTYIVRNIYKYTVDVEVEANSISEAKDAALYQEGIRNHDDYLYDCEIISEINNEE